MLLKKIGTKQVANLLKALEVKSALFVVDGDEVNFQKSTQNLPNTKVLSVSGLNVYDILKYEIFFCTPKVAESINERLS